MENLTSWLKYLETLHPKEMDLGLERIKIVAEKLNFSFSSSFIITVTGTNGKGSTVRLLENILLNAGYQVGAYTSPHLIKFNERIRVNNEEVSDQLLCEAFKKIELARQESTLTYFEFTTLAALLLFKQAQLDFIILEVGLGGRLDATNIVDADLALITNVALEHCEWLGDTREKIAYEKAGIIKPNKLVGFGERDIPKAILQQSRVVGAELFYLGRNYTYNVSDDGFVVRVENNTYQLPYPCVHPSNAALVVAAIETIRPRYKIPLDAIKNAIAETTLPGRLQFVNEPYPTLLDVAHNPHGIANLAEHLQKNYKDKKIIAVFSILADKDLAAILEIMQPIIEHWYIAPLQVSRAASLVNMQQLFNKLGINNYSTAATIAESYTQALKTAQTSPDYLIVVFGSFHTVSEALEARNKEQETRK